MTVAWFGIPGDMAGTHSTLTHALVAGRPLCGARLRPTMEPQWCGTTHGLMPECRACRKCMDAQRERWRRSA